MDVFWVASGAVAGLPGGTILRGQVAMLSVRTGEPDEVCCRHCAAPLRGTPGQPGLPALRCGHCRSWIGAPIAIELAAAGIVALLFARIGVQPALAGFAFLGVLGVALAQIDVAVQRLPDRLTLAGYPALIALLSLAAAVTGTWQDLVRALLGALVLGGVYLLLGLLSGGQLGGGDIKLAGLIGLVLGWAGWGALVAGASLGFVLAALAGLALLATRRISRRSMISFGPYMLAGSLLAILAVRW
jgi:leader peptidase (prepilin peptidase) / N-methyltransferase